MHSSIAEKFIITTEPPVGKRIPWIDFLKGVGIILVIFGHAQVPRSWLLYSFHMPLFFFISGYLYRDSPDTGFLYFTRKRTISLVIPYLFWSVISVAVYLVYESLNGNSEILITQLKRLLWTIDGNANNGGNDSIWFLSCLFTTALIYKCIDTYTRNGTQLLLTLAFCSIAGHVYSALALPGLPWKANVALSAIVFYGAGHIFHKNFNKLNIAGKFNRPVIIALMALSAILLVITSKANVDISGIKRVNMVDQVYGNYFLFYGAAFPGIFLFINLGLLVKKCHAIELLGQSSLLLLATHKLVFYLVPVPVIEYIDSLSQVIQYLDIILYTLIAILVTIPFIFLFNNFLPFIVGKKRIKPLQIIIELDFDEDTQPDEAETGPGKAKTRT